MSEIGRGKKEIERKKDIILMSGGNKKYYLSLALRWLCIVAK